MINDIDLNHRNRLGSRWATLLTVTIGSAMVIASSGKNVSLLSYLLLLACKIARPKLTYKSFVKLFILSIVLMFSPVDIEFRRVGRAGLRFLPVVYNLGSGQKKRDMEKDGKKENIDFVILKTQTPFMVTYYSIVVLY